MKSGLGGLLAVLLGAAAVTSASRAWAFESIQLVQTISAPSSLKHFTPASIAAAADGSLWVADPESHQIHIFSEKGEYQRSLGRRGKAPAEFDSPRTVTAAPDGRLYVADTGNARVQIFSSDGKWQGSFGDRGSLDGQMKRPAALAISLDGTVAIADQDSAIVQLFSADGIYLQRFDAGLAVTALAIDPAGLVYTAHGKTPLIQAWTSAGQLKASWTGAEPGVKAFENVTGLAIHPRGLLYLCDADARHFREMDLSGRLRGHFGRSGSGDGEFRQPSALAVRNSLLYVGDARLRRIAVFQVEPGPLPAAPTPAALSRLQLKPVLSLPMEARALAFNPDGTLHALAADEPAIVTWDLPTRTTTTLDLRSLTPALRSPTGLATAPSSGSLFVADEGLDQVLKLDRRGALLLAFKGLTNPGALACSTKGVLYALEPAQGRFQAFNHQGLRQFSAGEKGTAPGQLRLPVAIALDQDRVHIADAANKKLVTFTAAGRFLRETGALGRDAFVEPRDVAVDPEGYTYVLDAARARMVVFDPSGTAVGGFGGPGLGVGMFHKPRAIALSAQGDLAIAEAGRLQVIHVTVSPPPPTALQATAGEGFVALKWEAVPARFPVQYRVLRAAPGDAPQTLRDTVDTSFSDDTVAPNSTYTYRVMAQSANGVWSVPSAGVSVSARAVTSGPRIAIEAVEVQDVFSAFYKVYGREAFGRVRLRNASQAPARQVKLSVQVQEYMDFPSETTIAELKGESQQEVPVLATFNNKVLGITESTPLQAQVRVSWYSGSEETSVTRTVPFRLYSRNSIRWGTKESLAAFITPNDPVVLDFARSVAVPFAEVHAGPNGAPLPSSLVTAWSVFSGLGAFGIGYVPRPNNPYDRVSLDTTTVDTVQFARETLARKSGDCADVVVLLASLLESMTVNTAAIDVPGHLFLMVDTGESDVSRLALPEAQLIRYAGTWWLPLEATLLGQSFSTAWKQGADEYRRWAAQGRAAIIGVHEAWGRFEPATLPDNVKPIEAPSVVAVARKYLGDWSALIDLRWKTGSDAARAAAARYPSSGKPWLDLGLLAVEYRKYPEAVTYFQKAKDDAVTAGAAWNNLGNLAVLKGDWSGAENHYRKAAERDPADGGIWLNLARAQLRLGKKAEAQTALGKAQAASGQYKERYATLDDL